VPLALAAPALAGAIPAVTGPPNASLRTRPPAPLPGPPNGDFVSGLDGWTALGPELPPLLPLPSGGAVASLRLDTTLLSPPFVVPAGAQAIAVTARAPGVDASLDVRAHPEDGAPEVALGTLDPGSALSTALVPLPGLAGHLVRIVLDPVPAAGRGVEVRSVGPVETPLSGWTATVGLPVVWRDGARRVLRVEDDPLTLASSPFAPGPAATALIVAVRGDGRVRLDAGAGARTARARARWHDVRVPVRPGRLPAALVIEARPGRGGLRLADLGLVVRRTVARDLRAGRVGRTAVVRGRLVPAGGRLIVRASDRSGDALATVRTDAAGRFRLRLAATGRRVVLRTAGDRTRLAGRWTVRLPAPPPPPRRR
jgi:hypothetical protein